MIDLTRCWTVDAVAVTDPDAAALLRDYFTELAGRYYSRPATGREVDAAMAEEPSANLPLFLVARYGDAPAGCVGLRMLGARTAELTRMYIRPRYRRLGGGGALLAAVEQGARELGATAARLDTAATSSRPGACTPSTATSRSRRTPPGCTPITGSRSTSPCDDADSRWPSRVFRSHSVCTVLGKLLRHRTEPRRQGLVTAGRAAGVTAWGRIGG